MAAGSPFPNRNLEVWRQMEAFHVVSGRTTVQEDAKTGCERWEKRVHSAGGEIVSQKTSLLSSCLNPLFKAVCP